MQDYTGQLRELLAEGHWGDAMALFMRLVGVPMEQVERMRQAPTWPRVGAVASTLAYDHGALMGEEAAVHIQRAARVTVPALVLVGRASYGFMHQTAEKLAKTIPGARWMARLTLWPHPCSLLCWRSFPELKT